MIVLIMVNVIIGAVIILNLYISQVTANQNGAVIIKQIFDKIDRNFVITHNVQVQNKQLLTELTIQDERLLELQPLLFNDLTTNQTGISEIPHSEVYFLTDARFSDLGWGHQGFLGAKAINASTQDGIPIADIIHSLIVHAAKHPKMIISQGFQWGDPSLKISKSYPNVKFVVMTGLVQGPNVASIYPEQQQGSFILGALAAMLSKTHTIGFVGGQEYPNIVNIMDGYKQGAQYINPSIRVLENWTFDFNNITKGSQIANYEINQGADVLLHTADTSGQGVIYTANARGVTALGAVADQNHTLTSFVIDMKKAYSNAFNDVGIVKPGLETGQNATGPGIIYIAPFHGVIPLPIQQKIQQLENDVITGKIVIPERSIPN